MKRLLLLFLFCSQALALTPAELGELAGPAANNGDMEAQEVRRIEERRKQ